MRSKNEGIKKPSGTSSVGGTSVDALPSARIIDDSLGFKVFDLKPGDQLRSGKIPRANLVFMDSGSARISLDGKPGYLMNDEILIVSNREEFLLECDRSCRLVVYSFTILLPLALDYLKGLYDSTTSFRGFAVPILRQTRVLQRFTDLLYEEVVNNLLTESLMERKLVEAFHLIFRSYPSNQVLAFFIPLLRTETSEFINLILDNCDRVEKIDDLVAISGMCRTTFYRRFSREFGMTVHRWMQVRLAKKVLASASMSNMSVRKLMALHGFASASNFIRFTRMFFNCTPNELLAKLRAGEQVAEPKF